MPEPSSPATHDPCVLDHVQPLLSELHTPIQMDHIDAGHEQRSRSERFVRRVFRHAYGADIRSFYPNLLSFDDARRKRAVVGYRDGSERPLFAEQYLAEPAETAIARCTGHDIDRKSLVEVGNLALTDAGDARWVIAAVTFHLHRKGYRWVIFTAVRPLFNAFRRLGLNPLRLVPAEGARLRADDSHWGGYYDNRPVVCAGSIESGLHKLLHHEATQPPLLRALLEQASNLADIALRPTQQQWGGA
jgi:hypothetical protein